MPNDHHALDRKSRLALNGCYGLDSIVLARSLGGGRVNGVGLRLPEDEQEVPQLTRRQAFKRKLAEVWSSVAGV